jgi:uncharacterized membrane protein YdfJ with MMPL/SSD domain
VILTSRRWAWLVALVPIAMALVAMVALGEADRSPQPTDSLPDGLDSTRGVVLQERLPESDENTTIVVYDLADAASVR